MILKFRDSHIAKLERMQKKNNPPPFNDDKEIVSTPELFFSIFRDSMFLPRYYILNIYTLRCFVLLQELLKEEIKILAEKVEHHPDVTKFAMENLELRGKVCNSVSVLDQLGSSLYSVFHEGPLSVHVLQKLSFNSLVAKSLKNVRCVR